MAGADGEAGVALRRAEDDKRATYAELVASPFCRLLPLACEIGGRFSLLCSAFVRHLAAHKAAGAPPLLQAAARSAWATRWWTLLSVCQQDSLAASLLDGPPLGVGAAVGKEPPLAEVLGGGVLDDEPSRLPP